MQVSIIVCAYTEKRWDDLLAAIESIKMQSHKAEQIIVSIDHNDALFERAKLALPDVTLVRNTQERGLSGARNSAIEVAIGDVIVFMDEDAIAQKDWLEHLLHHYTDDNIAGVGGQIIPMWLANQPKWFPIEFQWVVGCTYRGMPTTSKAVRNLIGCNMSFRRDVFDAVGLFRNGIGRVGTLPIGCEETELCIRLHQAMPSAKLIYEPNAIVRHRVPQSRGTLRYFLSRCYSEGISKAMISQYVGQKDSLSSEQSYVVRILPSGMLIHASKLLRGDLAGVLRALAIPIGLLATTFGFLRGKFRTGKLPKQTEVAIPT